MMTRTQSQVAPDKIQIWYSLNMPYSNQIESRPSINTIDYSFNSACNSPPGVE